jgi:YHS domain-containing protein
MWFRLFIFIILIYLVYKVINSLKRSLKAKTDNHESKSTSEAGEDLVEDPVCHTYVPVSQAHVKEISGTKYYFCSKECGDKYKLERNY